MQNNKLIIVLLLALWLLVSKTQVQAVDVSQTGVNQSQIQYEVSDWETLPTDPEKPGETITPGGEVIKTEGPLRLDFIPKFNFGRQALSEDDRTYYVEAQKINGNTEVRGNFIQVTDHRGTLAGWELSVRQETQFLSEADKSKELSGAILSLDKQWANSIFDSEYQPTIVKNAVTINEIGTTYPIAIAAKGKGSGTWTIEFGSSGEKTEIESTLIESTKDKNSTNETSFTNTAISLFVPGKTKKYPVKYSTVLTWIISELT